MATYNTLTRGSTGADVKKLQQSLIDKGYDLGKTGADGKYGAITEAAVKQYQKDNKLTVDGMAGKQTQGALYTVPKPTTNTTTGAGAKQNAVLNANDTTGQKSNAVLKANDPVKKETLSQATGAVQNAVSGGATKAVEAAQDANQTHETDPLPAPAQEAPAAYDPATDAAYQSALSTLLQVQESKPTYKDSFSTQLQDAYNKIVNREKFSYDVNSDAMYQQMKDQYVAGGKLAMADTMGQAAALNGGYGSSYAQSVGQQAYQGYMQQLNDVIPELYDRALAQYNQEGQDMYNQYAMLGDMADDEYAKYQNELNDYYTRLSMAKNDVDTAYNRGYGAYRDSVGDYQWQQSFDEGNRQWQASFDHMVEREAIEDGRYDAEMGRADKNEAYSRLTSLIGTGYNPTDAELTAAGMTRDQYNALVNEYNENKALDAQPNAYNRIMSLVGTGYSPTDAELEAAGMTREQFNAYVSRYNKEESEANQPNEYNRVMSFIGTDYTPSDSELSKAGLTREQYDAMSKYAAAAASGTTLDNVASMSSEDIVNVLEGYKSETGEFDDAITAFLSDCVAIGRMTPAQAKELYNLYGSLAVEEEPPTSPQNNTFYNIVDRPYHAFKLEQAIR